MTAGVWIAGGSSTAETVILSVRVSFNPAVLLTSRTTTSEPVKFPSGT